MNSYTDVTYYKYISNTVVDISGRLVTSFPLSTFSCTIHVPSPVSSSLSLELSTFPSDTWEKHQWKTLAMDIVSIYFQNVKWKNCWDYVLICLLNYQFQHKSFDQPYPK